jgi:hypothetical protein
MRPALACGADRKAKTVYAWLNTPKGEGNDGERTTGRTMVFRSE